MRTFRNVAGQDITEEQILEEVKALFGEDHDADELGTIFVNYVNNAINNGNLTETTNENKNIRNKKGTITMKENYTEAVEVCPYCERENVYPNWDVSKQGYVAICQNCGKEIMLCDECLNADDNPGRRCDWCEKKNCFRHPK